MPKSFEGKPEFFTIAEVAERWRVQPATVRALVERGKLASFRAGRLFRIPLSAVLDHEAGSPAGKYKASLAASDAVLPAGPYTLPPASSPDSSVSPVEIRGTSSIRPNVGAFLRARHRARKRNGS